MTEKACSKCGEVKPAEGFYKAKSRTGLSSTCRACTATAQAARRAADPQKAKEIARRYSAKHSAKIAAKMRAFREKYVQDPAWVEAERVRAREKARREREQKPEAVRGRLTAYRARHPEKALRDSRRATERYRTDPAYRQRTKDRERIQKSLRRSIGILTQADIEWQLLAQAGVCAYCGVPFSDEVPHTLDHAIPVSRGGLTTPENTLLACRSCNCSKQARTPWEFRPDKFTAPTS